MEATWPVSSSVRWSNVRSPICAGKTCTSWISSSGMKTCLVAHSHAICVDSPSVLRRRARTAQPLQGALTHGDLFRHFCAHPTVKMIRRGAFVADISDDMLLPNVWKGSDALFLVVPRPSKPVNWQTGKRWTG